MNKYMRAKKQTIFMVRSFFFFLIFAICPISLSADSKKINLPIELKSYSEIDDDVIRVRDLFLNAPHHEDSVIASAPKPGDELIVRYPFLKRVVKAYGFKWRPTSASDYVLIKRTKQTISVEDIRNFIKNHLPETHLSDTIDIVFEAKLSPLLIQKNSQIPLKMNAFSYDEKTKKFTAHLILAADTGQPKTLSIRGVLTETISVPVLSRTMTRGEIISSYDINLRNIPANNFQNNIFLKKENIIGLEVRKVVAEGNFIKKNDLVHPILIRKGEVVTVEINKPGMLLSANMISMQNGVKGDIIRVKNIQSKTIIDVKVTGSNKAVTINNH